MGLSKTLPTDIGLSSDGEIRQIEERRITALEAIAKHLEESNQLGKDSIAQQQKYQEENIRWQNAWMAWHKDIYLQGQERQDRDAQALQKHTTLVDELEHIQRQMWVDSVSEMRKRLEMMERSHDTILARVIIATRNGKKKSKRRK